MNPITFLRPKRTIFHLTGGIGNQLFQYTAAKAYSKANNVPVEFNLTDAGKGFTNHGSSIQALTLELNIEENPSKSQQLVNRVLSKIDRTFTNFLSKKLFSFTSYRSQEIGYDETLLDGKLWKNVRGYFQSWRYLEIIQADFSLSEKSIKLPSTWFLELSERAIALKPIIIHIRRGDYKKLADSYGLLSSIYYEAAIRKVRSHLPSNPIWVISDDVSEARLLFDTSLQHSIIWVEPPIGTDPVESLILMSYASSNVIANSTFSWWGAVLNPNSVITVAPEKWFKGMSDPKDLYPPHWVLVPSAWQN